MLTRRILLLSMALVSAALGASAFLASVSAQEAWTRYHNARYGTSIEYQEFFEPDPPPANGDGQSFTGPEGANFRVYASLNQDGETPASLFRTLAADADHKSLTYQNIRNNRLTVSGTRGALIYYESYIFSAKGVIHVFAMEYPAKWKADYDRTVSRMTRSFTGP